MVFNLTFLFSVGKAEEISPLCAKFIKFINSTESFPEAIDIKSIVPDKILEDQQEINGFKKLYNTFYQEHLKVSEENKRDKPVQIFLANRAVLLLNTPDKKVPTKKSIEFYNSEDSIAMAFAILTGTGIDLLQIDDSLYLQTIRSVFNVTELDIIQGILPILQYSEQEIYQEIFTRTMRRLSSSDKESPQMFCSQILLPFMLMVCHGFSLPIEADNSISLRFNKTFKLNKDKKILLDYIVRFRQYLEGAPLDAGYLIQVNEILKLYKIRLKMDASYCGIYEITDKKIAVNCEGFREILMLKRSGLSPGSNEMGLSTCSEKDVTLNLDQIIKECDKIYFAINKNIQYQFFERNDVQFWNNLGIAYPGNKLNAVFNNLIAKDFSGNNKEEILCKLAKEVAVHEAKHKWDESLDTSRTWMTVDFELSAHFAEAIYCNNLYYGMFSLLKRMVGYARYPEIKSHIQVVINDIWKLLNAVNDNKLSKDMVRAELIKKYATLIANDKSPFPSLSNYEKNVVDKINQSEFGNCEKNKQK